MRAMSHRNWGQGVQKGKMAGWQGREEGVRGAKWVSRAGTRAHQPFAAPRRDQKEGGLASGIGERGGNGLGK